MNDEARILLAHGGGGQLSEDLIRETVLPRLGTDTTQPLDDAACVRVGDSDVFMTTDSYVVKPLVFPGGNIGKLAVCGTVNDLAVAGAKPLAITLALIIEEGFPKALLEEIMDSIGQVARESGVRVVTGDTKTVNAGAADGLFINTAGIGERLPNVSLGFQQIKPGDRILVSGSLGDHGMTIMSLREDIKLQSPLASDCACLAGLIQELLAVPDAVKFMRDPTRGGAAATLNEVARATGCGLTIRQKDIPIKPAVQAAADILGFDILNIANEGKLIAIVSEAQADACLAICRNHPLGQEASLFGVVGEQAETPWVEIETQIGGRRIVQMPYGRDLPRIC